MKIPNPIEYFRNKKRMLFRMVFCSEFGREVLMDLAHYCYLDRSTADDDPLKSARNEGRRQVILYILDWLNTSVLELGGNYDGTPNADSFATNGGSYPS